MLAFCPTLPQNTPSPTQGTAGMFDAATARRDLEVFLSTLAQMKLLEKVS